MKTLPSPPRWRPAAPYSFHDLTMHASHPNTERRERWTWVPTYRDAQADDPEYSFAVANVVVRGEGRS